MFSKLIDKVLELLIERLWPAIVKKWESGIRGKFTLISIATVVIAAAIFGNTLLLMAKLSFHFPWPWSYDGPLDKESSQLLDTVTRLEAVLETELLKIRSKDGLLDAWTYADIIVALDNANAAGLLPEQHRDFFLSQVKSTQCWTQYRKGNIDYPCHMGATAWILLALAKVEAEAPQEVWDFLIEEQDKSDGWWALYENANQTQANASLYSTAMLVLAINEHFERGLIRDAQSEALSSASEHATQWIVSVQLPAGCRWLDYPYRGNLATEIGALSGLAMHTLAQVNYPGMEPIHKVCLARFADDDIDLGSVSVSNQTIRFADGSTSDDHVRHENLIWQGVAMEACYIYGNFIEKAKVRLYMKTLLEQQGTPEHSLQRWHQAEFLVMLKNMMGKDVL